MPQITIRTSPEIYIPANTSNLNPYYKEFVNQLLSIAPDLSVAKTDVDNSNSYGVTLSIMGNPDVVVQFYCSGTNLFIYPGYWDKTGAFKTFISTSMRMFAAGQRFKVSSYGVDGTLVYVAPYSDLSSSSQIFFYGMFTSTGNESPQFSVNVTSASYVYPEPAVIPFCYTMPQYVIGPTKDNSEVISYSSLATTAFVKTGYTHALLPSFYYAESSSKAFLNVKWGGKYNIYRLYDADGIVRTRPGDIVTINGVEMLSPGYVAVIE